jgi:hypothetical protein
MGLPRGLHRLDRLLNCSLKVLVACISLPLAHVHLQLLRNIIKIQILKNATCCLVTYELAHY